MKILFFQSYSFIDQGIINALKRLSIDFDIFLYRFSDWEDDEKFLGLFERQLTNECYRCVLSANFSPFISKLCEDKQIPYIAWIYDSPIPIKDFSVLKNSYTKIYLFDRGQAEEFQKDGIQAEHMPLAVDPGLFDLNVPAKVREDYDTDVSLVGRLYSKEYLQYKESLNKYFQGYLEGMVCAQMKIYGGYLMPELITQTLLDQINMNTAKEGIQISEYTLEHLLACEVTGRERYTALAALSEYYRTDLYATEKDERLKKVRYRGYADYRTQIPLVFSKSRINLNISMKSIRTGVPLRVLDIMGCGGFVLSNYQEELAEYFVPGEECAVYENLEDLYAKTQFYLVHDAERERIACNGFEKVKRDFTFEDRIKRMILL